MMPIQRVCDAEKQTGNKLSNGPLRAQSNGKGNCFGSKEQPKADRYPFFRVFCDAAGKRINAEDMLVSCLSARVKS